MVNINWKTAVVAVLGVIVAYEILKRDALKGAATIGSAINPVSQGNIFNQGVNSVGAAVTGDKSFSLGSWLYDVTHPGK